MCVRGLKKRYGDGSTQVDALLGIDLDVAAGEIVGILGPNGAGKTTLVEILEGIRAFDVGQVEVLGAQLGDPKRLKALRRRMGISLQHSVLPPLLTVTELITLQHDLFASSVDVSELIDRMGLADKRDTRVAHLSGGQQQRVAVAMSLVGDPELMFLDEPTSQLDPHARRVVWESFDDQRRRRGAAILITTHQMEEAQRICDRVLIMSNGRIIAQGPPAKLIEAHCPERYIEFVAPKLANLDFIADRAVCEPQPEGGMRVRVETLDAGRLLTELVARQEQLGGELHQLRIEQPTLEDVFVKLIGIENSAS